MATAAKNHAEVTVSAGLCQSAGQFAAAAATNSGTDNGPMSGVGVEKFHPGGAIAGSCRSIVGVNGANVLAREAELPNGIVIPEVSCARAPLGFGDWSMV